MVRDRMIIALVGLFTLAGCARQEVAPQLDGVERRMPVVVDYYDHLTLHPVRHYPTGRVDPIEPGVGRFRKFGNEPAAQSNAADDPGAPVEPEPRPKTSSKPKPDSLSETEWTTNSFLAELDALRSRQPATADYLALSTPRKSKPNQKAAKADVTAADDDFDTPSAADASRTADNRGVEDQDGGYRLNFDNAEVTDVLQAVLGRVLGLTYTVAPNVAGRITISSSAVQSRAELLATLETVLSMQGLSLTKTGSIYRVAPASVGGGTLDDDGASPGFGISVVPLRYSSVASMSKLINGFVTDTDGVRIDTSRNTVIIRGPGPKRAEIIHAIQKLDGDWMHTQSVSMFELKRSRPDEVIEELTRIFANDKDGGSEGVIQFKPVKRLRSIMVISKSELLIRRAGKWIRRLDHQDTSQTSSVFIYRPHYRDARELTKLVNGLFGQTDSSAPGVSFQDARGDEQRGRNGGVGGGIGARAGNGLSSASYAGGLSASAGLGGAGGGIGGGGTGGGAISNSSRGTGNGLKGDLADPVEAGDAARGDGEKLKLTADTSNNTIVAYTDGETFAKVKSVLQQLDIPPLQVAVNVIIAEVQLNDELKYGVQFFLNQSAKSGGSVGFSTSPTSLVQSAAQGAAAGVGQVLSPTSGFNFIGGATSPNVIISALDSISKVHILSTPSIVVMENKAATLEVGNQVPVTTQQAQSNLTADAPTVNSVTYLDTGIILKIIPRVGQNGVVDMQIDQEISSVVPDASGSTTSSLTPTISKRRIASDISVKSGQNVLLAGLVTDTRSRSNGQVPFIGPQLGNLLGNTDNAFSRTELVMFLRPVIIRHGQDAAEVTQDFRRGLTSMDLHAPPVLKP